MGILTGDQAALRRSVALCKMVLAGAILCGAASIPEARAQMHAQSFELVEATIPQLQSALSTGIVTSHDLVAQYLARIEAYDQHGPTLNAISVTNGNALAEADARDAECRAGARRWLLHGIQIIVKGWGRSCRSPNTRRCSVSGWCRY